MGRLENRNKLSASLQKLTTLTQEGSLKWVLSSNNELITCDDGISKSMGPIYTSRIGDDRVRVFKRKRTIEADFNSDETEIVEVILQIYDYNTSALLYQFPQTSESSMLELWENIQYQVANVDRFLRSLLGDDKE